MSSRITLLATSHRELDQEQFLLNDVVLETKYQAVGQKTIQVHYNCQPSMYFDPMTQGAVPENEVERLKSENQGKVCIIMLSLSRLNRNCSLLAKEKSKYLLIYLSLKLLKSSTSTQAQETYVNNLLAIAFDHKYYSLIYFIIMSVGLLLFSLARQKVSTFSEEISSSSIKGNQFLSPQ